MLWFNLSPTYIVSMVGIKHCTCVCVCDTQWALTPYKSTLQRDTLHYIHVYIHACTVHACVYTCMCVYMHVQYTCMYSTKMCTHACIHIFVLCGGLGIMH